MTRDDTVAVEHEALDRISLVGLSATGYHGVLPEERRAGQLFRADVVVHVDTRAAAAADDLTRTVNYATLAQDVVRVLTGEPVDLIETLAQRLADVALAVERVEAVDVVVHKPQAPVGVPLDDVRVSIHRRRRSRPDALDRRPEDATDVVLALGGNIGDVQETLRQAIEELDAAPGLSVVRVSPLARTAPVGPPQDDYLNAVVIARTTLSPRELLTLTAGVEDAHGRRRGLRWGPRTLDIDIVAFDGVRSHDPELQLPHPRAWERAFVLLPWAAVDPAAILPGGGSVSALAEQVPDREDVRWVAQEGWHRAGRGA